MSTLLERLRDLARRAYGSPDSETLRKAIELLERPQPIEVCAWRITARDGQCFVTDIEPRVWRELPGYLCEPLHRHASMVPVVTKICVRTE